MSNPLLTSIACTAAAVLSLARSPIASAGDAPEPTLTVTCLAERPAHALAFSPDGRCFCAKENHIWAITPDGRTTDVAELPTPVDERPSVWSLAWHEGSFYAAAHDRIVRIALDGSVTELVREPFPGLCGVTDLAFAADGRLYVAYADKIARYDADWHKTVVLEASSAPVPLGWLTSFRIDAAGRFWISDVGTKLVLFAELDPKTDRLQVRRVVALPEHPEYLAIAADGRVFVGFPDADAIAQLSEDGSYRMIPLSGQLDFPASMAFGGPAFDSASLYIACNDGTKRVQLAAKSTPTFAP